MAPSLLFLDNVIHEKQGKPVKYLADLQDIFCNYSMGDSECKTCPTIPICPKRTETRRHDRRL